MAGVDGDSGVAIERLEEASRRGDVRALLEALEHADFRVRAAAALALGEVGGERARIPLKALSRDRWGDRPEVRIAALWALGSLMGPGPYAELLEEFVTAENRKVVPAARRMLEAADPAGYPGRLASRGCLDHSAINVYGSAREASAVGLIGEFMEERMRSGDLAAGSHWGKVYAGVRALGKIGGGEAMRVLEAVLEHARREAGDAVEPLKRSRLMKIERAAGEAAGRA